MLKSGNTLGFARLVGATVEHTPDKTSLYGVGVGTSHDTHTPEEDPDSNRTNTDPHHAHWLCGCRNRPVGPKPGTLAKLEVLGVDSKIAMNMVAGTETGVGRVMWYPDSGVVTPTNPNSMSDTLESNWTAGAKSWTVHCPQVTK